MKKKTAGIVLGAGAAAMVGLYFVTRKAGAEEPPEPEPGLANLFGVVMDSETGEGISGVLVSLDGIETHTDKNGYYAIENVDPGEYTLQFSKDGYKTAVY